MEDLRGSSISLLRRDIDCWLASEENPPAAPAAAVDMQPPNKVARITTSQARRSTPREEWVLTNPSRAQPAAASGSAGQGSQDERSGSPLARARLTTREQREALSKAIEVPPQSNVRTIGGHSVKGAALRSMRPDANVSHLIIDEVGRLINIRAASSKASAHAYSAKQLDTPPVFRDAIRDYLAERHIDPLSRDVLILPTRSVMREWSIVVINNPSKSITFYSRGMEKGDAEMLKAAQLLQHAFRHQNKKWEDGYRRVVKNCIVKGATQRDSGIIACVIMEMVSRGKEPALAREDISIMRLQLVADIMSDTLTQLR